MADEKNLNEEMMEVEIYTLTDDEGNASDFELLAELTDGGRRYLALLPVEEDAEEYVILTAIPGENEGEELLETIDDAAEFERVAAAFDELFAEEE